MAATSAAFAQSTVTLYGIVDANYGTRTTTTEGYEFKKESKATGLTDGATNGLSGSRWGIRGSEDLGGGLKANFTLESALTVNDGSSTGFTRRSIVGLSGGFGSIDFGREYSPAFSAASGTDVTSTDGYGTTSTSQALSADMLTAIDENTAYAGTVGFQVRRSNSINYTSPSFSGVVVKGQLSRNTTKSATATTAKDNGLGLSASYTAGPLMVVVAMDQQKGLAVPGTPTLLATAEGKTTSTLLGGTYDLGIAKLFANFHQTKLTNTDVAGWYAKGREVNVGVQVPMGAVTLIAGAGTNKLTVGETGEGSVSGKGNDYVLGANYAMSKRTTAYFRTGTKNSLKVNMGEGYSGNEKTTGYHIGIRHSF